MKLKSSLAVSEQHVYSTKKFERLEGHNIRHSRHYIISSELSLMILSRLPLSNLLMVFYY
jgi:hypothetical protein